MIYKNNKIIISEKRLAKFKKVVANHQKNLILILEDIYDPHNAGAILRSADGFGVQKVYFIFQKVPAYNPKKVGKVSSSSANKWIDVEIFKSSKECLKKIRRQRYKIFATVLDKDEMNNIYKTDFLKEEKIALLVGNEHSGLSDEAIELAHQKIYIPMKGMVQSFNVSVTTAIFLYEITRQRERRKKDFLLSEKDQKKLLKSFLAR